MASKNYQIGANFELRVKKHMEEKLHCQVVRSSGSHGIFDLVATRMADSGKTETVYIQCKTNGYIHPNDKKVIIDKGKEIGCEVLLAYKDKNNHNRIAFTVLYSPEANNENR
jgi:hypothetical protein